MGLLRFFDRSDYVRVRGYSAGSTNEPSLLYQHVLKPLALKAVGLLPMWVAPNVLTLGGLACVLAHYGLVAAYAPSFSAAELAALPGWLPGAVVFFFAAYMMLDNMDGRQAVRTRAFSPFGELLDHSCDSLVVGLGAVVQAAMTQTGPWSALVICAGGMPSFYSGHHLEYFTEHLELPKWTGPTEVIVVTICMYLFTWIAGAQVWLTPLLGDGWTFIDGSELVWGHVPALAAALGSVGTVLHNGRLTIIAARKRGASVTRVMHITTPFVAGWVAAALWVIADPAIVTEHPHLFLTGISVAFSYIVIGVIATRMLAAELPLVDYGSLPLALAGAAAVTYGPEYRTTIVQLWWIATMIIYAAFVREGINGFCSALGIRLLSITPATSADSSDDAADHAAPTTPATASSPASSPRAGRRRTAHRA